jgi:hypothetical protein
MSSIQQETIKMHPLVKAGQISEDLPNVLVTLTFDAKCKTAPGNKGGKKARNLTTNEVEEELIEKDNIKKEKEEKSINNKLKGIEGKVALEAKREDIRKRKT